MWIYCKGDRFAASLEPVDDGVDVLTDEYIINHQLDDEVQHHLRILYILYASRMQRIYLLDNPNNATQDYLWYGYLRGRPVKTVKVESKYV